METLNNHYHGNPSQVDLMLQCNPKQNLDSFSPFLKKLQADCRMYIKSKCPKISKPVLKKKNKVGGLIFPDCKTYHKAGVISAVWYWYKDRYIIRKEKSQEINLYWSTEFWCQGHAMEKRVFSITGNGTTEYLCRKE